MYMCVCVIITNQHLDWYMGMFEHGGLKTKWPLNDREHDDKLVDRMGYPISARPIFIRGDHSIH